MLHDNVKDRLKNFVNDLERLVTELGVDGNNRSVVSTFRGKVKSIQEKLEVIDEPLFVALIGGTGVGKSALINALASKVISKSSVKRAFTSHKVFFCHQKRADQVSQYPFFQKGLDEVSLHQEFPLEDVVLVDLPDVDSDVPSHPQQVNAMIPRADIVIWQVDHEKYNDNILHEKYLSALANYQKSFLFVFNRIDELIENKPNRQQAIQNLERLVEHFLEVLKEDGYPGVSQNRLFKISAKRALESKEGKAEDFSENEFDRLEKLIRDQVSMKQMGQMKFLEDIHSIISELKAFLHFDRGFEVVQRCQRLLADIRQDPLTSLPKMVENKITIPLFKGDFRKNLEEIVLNRVETLVGGFLGFMINFRFGSQEKSLEDLYAYLDEWEVFIDSDAVYHRLHKFLRDFRKEWGSEVVGWWGSEGPGDGLSTTSQPHYLTTFSLLTRDQFKKLLEIERERLKTYLKNYYTRLSEWEMWGSRQHTIPLAATATAIGLPALSYISRIASSGIHLDEIFLWIQSSIFSLILVPIVSYFLETVFIKRRIRQTVRVERDNIKEQVQKDILKSLEEHILQPIEMQLAKYEKNLQQVAALEKDFRESQPA
jgi:GTPase Era involved in 16S rRNA processing